MTIYFSECSPEVLNQRVYTGPTDIIRGIFIREWTMRGVVNACRREGIPKVLHGTYHCPGRRLTRANSHRHVGNNSPAAVTLLYVQE